MIQSGKIFNKLLSVVIVAALTLSNMGIQAYAADTNIALDATASTSYCSSWESIDALNDGYDPSDSNDRSHDVYGNWDKTGTQWVQYDWSESYVISSCDVYWFDDNEGIDLPSSCAIKYWDGSTWVNVSDPVGLGVSGNQYNTTTFTPVTTNRLRLEIVSNDTYSTGILEWKVYGTESENPAVTRVNDSTIGTGLNQFEYVGNWTSATRSEAYNNDEHWSLTADDYLQIRFYGRQIKVYASKDTDFGTFCPSIDDGPESSWSSWQVVPRNRAIIYESRVLPLGDHTLKIRVAGLKNPDTPNTGTKFYIDYVDIYTTGIDPTSPPHGDTPIVTSPPSWCDPFYTKCVMVQDIPIVSSDNVSDSSLIRMFNVADVMLTKIMDEKPEIYQKMLQNNVKITVEGLNEYNMSLPEWTWQPSCDFNATFRGSNGGRESLIIEEDLIANTSWLMSYSVPCHEFAHTILAFGIGDLEYPGAAPEVRDQIVDAYNAAIAADKYTESSYDRSNIHEYFAGQVGRYFNANPVNLNVPNASSKTSRQQLQEYDPNIYNILSTLFGDYQLPAPWN